MNLETELRAGEDAVRQEKAELTALQRELSHTREELDRAREITNLIDKFDSRNLVIPHWTRDTAGKAGKKAIATLQLSDTHFDEVIKPEQIGGFNAYNQDIALKRLKKLGNGMLKVAFDYIAGVQYEGAAIIATGDIFSGDIHEELRRTNERPLLASIEFWVEPMVSMLQELADEFKKVHVGAVVGNHGREPGKPIYKNRAQSNVEWLYWHYVASVIAAQKDTRITFDIADGLSSVMKVYNTTYEYEHGDEFKGGTGIAGAKSPLMLALHRTSVQRMAMKTPMDYMVVGHFHQYQPPSQGLIMGGSLKGYDEYAAGKKFRPERPIQGFWVTSPEHGPTISAPIFCDDRKAEGW